MEPIQQDIHRYLVERCLAHDTKAQYHLYKLYANAMFNVCMRMLKREEDAQDALQEAFVDAFAKLHSFRFDAPFGAWLKRIVINRCISNLQKKKLLTVYADEEKLDRFADPEAEDFGFTEMEVKHVMHAIQKLPEGCRVVLNLYLFEGYDHAEIAEILGVTESTSKAQYSKAKKKLRDTIAAQKAELQQKSVWKIN